MEVLFSGRAKCYVHYMYVLLGNITVTSQNCTNDGEVRIAGENGVG